MVIGTRARFSVIVVRGEPFLGHPSLTYTLLALDGRGYVCSPQQAVRPGAGADVLAGRLLGYLVSPECIEERARWLACEWLRVIEGADAGEIDFSWLAGDLPGDGGPGPVRRGASAAPT